ncbi:MAG: SGNH/GDSL hydrolase family protein [Treponema sp.]|nr:SGNH/GDSL hydrolase family protein [Treponema sp.]
MKNGINKISAYGDSILKGAVTGTDSGHLFDIIEDSSLVLASKALGFDLNNQSVFGSIVSKTQRRLNRDIEKGIFSDLAIIESGGNDCDYDWTQVSSSPDEKHLPRTTLEDFIQKISEMVDVCRKNKITPLIMTMPPLVRDRWYNHILHGQDENAVLKILNDNPDRLYQNHELYNISLVEYALKNSVQIVDMRKEMLLSENYRNLMCLDGIHPNEKGYKFMSEIWIRELPEVQKEF